IVLTNRRVTQHIAYLIGGEERSVSLHNITEVRIRTPPLGVLLGFANVDIQSMGGDQAPEIHFQALERAAQLKQMIFAVQDQMRRQMQR
ncbi:MAG: PH domain-containing protein, partial [Aggregatilineales bacterium]